MIKSVAIHYLKSPRVVVSYDNDEEITLDYSNLKERYRGVVAANIDEKALASALKSELKILEDLVSKSKSTDSEKAAQISEINTYGYKEKIKSEIKDRLIEADAAELAETNLIKYLRDSKLNILDILKAESIPEE